MTATITTQENETTTTNVVIDPVSTPIGRDAAYTLITLITNNLSEMYEHMDEQEYTELTNLVITLRAEVY